MLFLVRHAHAVPQEEDPLRPLSLHGVDECTRLVRFFSRNGAFLPSQLWHSPLARSRETADRLAAGLTLDAARIEVPGLEPDDDPHIILERLNALPPQTDLAVIGHCPHLARLATLMVRGKAKPFFCDFKKGAVLALEKSDSSHKRSDLPRWEVAWFIPPTLFPLNTSMEIAPGL